MPTIAEATAEVNRVWREFKRYTGDGLPGEPTNAALPVGDPQSGVHNAKKSELRAMLIAALVAAGLAVEAAEDAVDRAEIEADRAEAAADAAEAALSSITNNSFANRAAALSYSPAVGPTYLRLEGYTNAGDGGGALYKKVASEPAHAGKFSITLEDGATVVWYEIAQKELTPAMFGAVGEGADETAAMSNAIAALAAGGKLNGLGKTYKALTTLPLPTQPNTTLENIKLDFSGAANNGYLLLGGGVMGTAAPLNGGVAALSLTVPVTNANIATAGIQAGDWCIILTTNAWDSGTDGAMNSQTVQVKSVGTDSLTLHSPILYVISSGATIAKIVTLDNFTMRRVEAFGSAAGPTGEQIGCKIQFTKNFVAEDCKFTKFDGMGLWIHRGIYPEVRGGEFGYGQRTGSAYGIAIGGGSFGAKVLGASFADVRHGVSMVDITGISRATIIANCTFSACRHAAIDGHAAYDDLTVIGNIIHGDGAGGQGVQGRGTNTKVIDNIIRDVDVGVSLEDNVVHLNGNGEARGNRIQLTAASLYGIVLQNLTSTAVNSFIVEGNHIIGKATASSTGIYLYSLSGNISLARADGNTLQEMDRSVRFRTAGTFTIGGGSVSRNIIKSLSAALEGIRIDAATDGNVQHMTVNDNNIHTSGSYEIYCNNEEYLVCTGNLCRGATNPVFTSATNKLVNNLEV